MSDDARLLDRVFRAHGAIESWRRVWRIDASFSSGGLAYVTRLQEGKLLRHRISVFPHEMRTIIRDYPTAGQTGHWQRDQVRIEPFDEAPARVRDRARDRFATWRARLYWDDLDLLYFVGYALWNYLSFPFLLHRHEVDIAVGKINGRSILDVRFPHDFPTHSRRQYFQIDKDGLLVRHDYVAEVFGRWAAGANFCRANSVIEGLRFYTRRRVVPSLGRSAALPFPTLVWIELDDLRILPRAEGAAVQMGRTA